MLLKNTAAKRSSAQAKDVVLWCLTGVMAVALYLAPEKTPGRVILGLLCMAALALHPALHLPWVVNAVSKKARVARSSVALFGVGALIVLYGWLVWPPPRRHVFDLHERYAFEKPLTEQQSPREEIRIACPTADEKTCVYAAQFIDFFREAGWKVQGNSVERTVLGKPLAGVIFFQHGTGKLDPSNWRSGLWTAFSPSLENVRQAFVNVGIEPEAMADPAYPEGVIGVFFGAEKANPKERTQLTDDAEKITRARRSGQIPSRP